MPSMKSPYDAPRSDLEHVQREEAEYLDLPGFGVRAGARVIDMAINLGIGLGAGLMGGIMLVIAELAGVIQPGWDSRIENMGLVENLIGVVMAVSYGAVAEWVGGATLGKAILGLRVLHADGQRRIGMGAALGRNLAFYIDSFFFGLVGYHAMSSSPINQRYGDKWASTRVVRAREMPHHLHSLPRVGMGLALGCVVGMGSGAAMFVVVASLM